MNQLLRLNDKAVIWAFDRNIHTAAAESMYAKWKEALGEAGADIRLLILPETQIVETGDGSILFQFSGSITPTMVAEFQRWWEGAALGA